MGSIPGIPGNPMASATPQTGPQGAGQLKIEDILKMLGVTNPAAASNIPLTQTQSTVPGLQQPIPQRQYPNVHDSSNKEFQTIGGHKRANINDIFQNVGEMVKTSQKNKEAQSTRALAVDLERLMTAASNPNDPANQQIIVDMLSDPKKAKAIAKALDISFMGEDKRDNVSKGALDSALKKVGSTLGIGGQAGGNQGIDPSKLQALKQQQGQPGFSEQLGKTMGLPQVQGMSPQLQMMMQAIKGGVLPSADTQMKSQTDLLKTVFNTENKVQVADILAGSRDKATSSKLIETMMNVAGRKYTADVMASATIRRAQIMADAYIQKAESSGKPDKETEEAIKQANSLNAAIKQAADQVKNTPSEWWGLSSKKKDEAKERLKDLQGQYQKLQDFINQKRMNKGADASILGDTSGGSSTGNGDSTKFNADDFVNSFSDFKDITGGGEE